MGSLRDIADSIAAQENELRLGGGIAGQARQRKLGRLPVRERLSELLDPGKPFLEIGLWSAFEMYPEFGEVPAAGIVCGLGWIHDRPCLVAANDASVKAGAMFPQSVKKLIRAQKIAFQFRVPVVYLVDSAGVFLPLQDEIFRTKMTLVASFETTRSSLPWVFRRSQPSWAIASQVGPICRSCAIRS